MGVPVFRTPLILCAKLERLSPAIAVDSSERRPSQLIVGRPFRMLQMNKAPLRVQKTRCRQINKGGNAMSNFEESVGEDIKSLHEKFEGEADHQQILMQQTNIIRNIVCFAAIVFFIVLLQTIIRAFINNHGIAGKSILTVDLRDLLSPLAVVFSVLTATYIALYQLGEKKKRDRIEHAHNICSSAPDINIVFASFGPLNNHFEDAYRNCIEASNSSVRKPQDDGAWEVFITKMEHMAESFPSVIKNVPKNLRADHINDLSKINEALAFFEKAATAISEGHADDSVVWSRYNVAGLSIWIYSFPIIINRWIRHKESKYLANLKTVGLPFEHYEGWLRFHSKAEGNSQLVSLLDRLSDIRKRVLSTL